MNECMYEGRLESLTWLTKLTEIGLLKKKKIGNISLVLFGRHSKVQYALLTSLNSK